MENGLMKNVEWPYEKKKQHEEDYVPEDDKK
jgi:hypothetical protein